MNYYINENGTLCEVSDQALMHYGVKGMRWGHRKKPELSSVAKNVQSTKADYKSAKKAYDKAYWKADSKRHQAFSFSKAKREANDKRWEDVVDKADKMFDAKDRYKTAKKERKRQIRDTHRDLNKKATLGEKLTYNDATRKKAAKYIVDNNMSVAEATKKAKGDAWRNTAVLVGAYGAMTVAALYANR
jgi:hypothetical protein